MDLYSESSFFFFRSYSTLGRLCVRYVCLSGHLCMYAAITTRLDGWESIPLQYSFRLLPCVWAQEAPRRLFLLQPGGRKQYFFTKAASWRSFFFLSCFFIHRAAAEENGLFLGARPRSFLSSSFPARLRECSMNRPYGLWQERPRDPERRKEGRVTERRDYVRASKSKKTHRWTDRQADGASKHTDRQTDKAARHLVHHTGMGLAKHVRKDSFSFSAASFVGLISQKQLCSGPAAPAAAMR